MDELKVGLQVLGALGASHSLLASAVDALAQREAEGRVGATISTLRAPF